MVKLEVGDMVVQDGSYSGYPPGSDYNLPREPIRIAEGGSDNGYIKLWLPSGVVSPPVNPGCFMLASDAAKPAASTGAERRKLNELPYDLVPYQEITDAYVRVAEKGAQIYAPWNWTKGLPRIQILCSLLRHTFAYLRGEDRDKETGLSHTDHILWNAVALSHSVHHGLEDGRRGEPERDYKKYTDC